MTEVDNGTLRMDFPRTRPDESAAALWQLQQELLLLAEGLLGPRDGAKKIYQPQFQAGGPSMWNTPSLDGAFAELSLNAAGYWPTAAYELAHETVHLLNPTIGYTNWLEEGVAVAFSQYALTHYGLAPFEPTLPTYAEAMKLVHELPEGPFVAPREARLAAGSLSAVKFEHLLAAAPAHPREKLDRLVSQCVPR
jgi:hypothetical protein